MLNLLLITFACWREPSLRASTNEEFIRLMRIDTMKIETAKYEEAKEKSPSGLGPWRIEIRVPTLPVEVKHFPKTVLYRDAVSRSKDRAKVMCESANLPNTKAVLEVLP